MQVVVEQTVQDWNVSGQASNMLDKGSRPPLPKAQKGNIERGNWGGNWKREEGRGSSCSYQVEGGGLRRPCMRGLKLSR